MLEGGWEKIYIHFRGVEKELTQASKVKLCHQLKEEEQGE